MGKELMPRLARFNVPAEEAAHIDYPDSTTEFTDGWVPVSVTEQADGSLVVYAYQRPGDE